MGWSHRLKILYRIIKKKSIFLYFLHTQQFLKHFDISVGPRYGEIIYLFCDTADAKYCNLLVPATLRFEITVQTLSCFKNEMMWVAFFFPLHHQYLRAQSTVSHCAVKCSPVVFQLLVESQLSTQSPSRLCPAPRKHKQDQAGRGWESPPALGRMDGFPTVGVGSVSL